jgi:hypothetical protein
LLVLTGGCAKRYNVPPGAGTLQDIALLPSAQYVNIYNKYDFPSGAVESQNLPKSGNAKDILAEFERTVRHSTIPEMKFYPNDLSKAEGLVPIIYPIPIRQQAQWKYVEAGDRFLLENDLGAANVSYWSALVLTSKSFSSRPEKEGVRYSAYKGLAEIAYKKDQQAWAEMMNYCADLAGTYLKSDKAVKDKYDFYVEIENIRKQKIDLDREVQKNKERLEEESSRNSKMQLFAVLTAVTGSLASAQAYSKSPLMQQQQVMQQQITNMSDLAMRINEANTSYTEAMKKVSEIDNYRFGKFNDFKEYVASEATEIEAGNSFITRETVHFLLGSDNPGSYLEVIEKYSVNKPEIRSAVELFRKNNSNMGLALEKLAEALKNYEMAVVKAERRGKKL